MNANITFTMVQLSNRKTQPSEIPYSGDSVAT